MRAGSTIAELLVCLSILGLALCMFAPTSEEVADYTLDIVIAVVAVGAVVVCVAADCKPKKIAFGLLFYFLVWPPVCLLILVTFYPQVLRCASLLSL